MKYYIRWKWQGSLQTAALPRLPILIARFNETVRKRERERGIGIGIQSRTRTIRRKRLASRYPARRLRKNWSILRHPAKAHHVAFPRSSMFISRIRLHRVRLLIKNPASTSSAMRAMFAANERVEQSRCLLALREILYFHVVKCLRVWRASGERIRAIEDHWSLRLATRRCHYRVDLLSHPQNLSILPSSSSLSLSLSLFYSHLSLSPSSPPCLSSTLAPSFSSFILSVHRKSWIIQTAPLKIIHPVQTEHQR